MNYDLGIDAGTTSARAGIFDQRGNMAAAGRRVKFHSLRMVFGTWLAVSGAHPRAAMELTRHRDLKLTMTIYIDAALPRRCGRPPAKVVLTAG